MKRRIPTWGITAFVLLASCLVIGGSAAQASEIQLSGIGPFTIADDAKLVGDISCTGLGSGSFAGACITVAAPDVSLKLNGFTINGPELTVPCPDAVGATGIHVALGNRKAKIKGPGKVEGFVIGIHIDNADKSRWVSCFSGHGNMTVFTVPKRFEARLFQRFG